MMSALSHVSLYIYISIEDAVIKTPCDNYASLDHNLSQSEGSSIVVDDDGYSRKDRQL